MSTYGRGSYNLRYAICALLRSGDCWRSGIEAKMCGLCESRRVSVGTRISRVCAGEGQEDADREVSEPPHCDGCVGKDGVGQDGEPRTSVLSRSGRVVSLAPSEASL